MARRQPSGSQAYNERYRRARKIAFIGRVPQSIAVRHYSRLDEDATILSVLPGEGKETCAETHDEVVNIRKIKF